jgi:hypothetical protein
MLSKSIGTAGFLCWLCYVAMVAHVAGNPVYVGLIYCLSSLDKLDILPV